jgi:chaperone modulatory protein CbpM
MWKMQTENLIALNEFCLSHNIEISFISSLQQNGLIEITTIKETGFIDAGQLQQLEKYIRFYYDLDINLEGIETIAHLLQRINSLQDEIIALKNRLRLYEPID